MGGRFGPPLSLIRVKDTLKIFDDFAEATKLYFTHYSCVVITGLYGFNSIRVYTSLYFLSTFLENFFLFFCAFCVSTRSEFEMIFIIFCNFCIVIIYTE